MKKHRGIKNVTAIIALYICFWPALQALASDSGTSERWIEVPVYICVLDNSTKGNIEGVINRLNAVLAQARIKLVFKGDLGKINVNTVGGPNSLTEKEGDAAVKAAEDLLRKQDANGGIIIVVCDDVYVEDPNVVGRAGHRVPVLLVESLEDPCEMGSAAAHEDCHIMTLDYDIYKDTSDPCVIRLTQKYTEFRLKRNLMWGIMGTLIPDFVEELLPEQIAELRGWAIKMGRFSQQFLLPPAPPLEEILDAVGRLLDPWWDPCWDCDPGMPCVRGDPNCDPGMPCVPGDPNCDPGMPCAPGDHSWRRHNRVLFEFGDLRNIRMLCCEPLHQDSNTSLDIQLGGLLPVNSAFDMSINIYIDKGPTPGTDAVVEIQISRDGNDPNLLTGATYENLEPNQSYPLGLTIYEDRKDGPEGRVPASNSLEVIIPTWMIADNLAMVRPIMVKVDSMTYDFNDSVQDPVVAHDSTSWFEFGFSQDPNAARYPWPFNAAWDVPRGTTPFSWSAGAGAASHDVYFGTSSASLALQSNQAGTTWTPASTLIYCKTYYWRVNERDDSNDITAYGNLWSFTTGTGKAANPVPDNGSYNIRIPVKLAWRAGDVSGIMHDVYFGAVSADVNSAERSGAVYKGNYAIGITTYTPNGILLDKRYYWRIDEVISYPTLTRGDIWTFTTSPIFYADDFQSFASTTALKNAWKGTGTANNALVYQVTEGTDKSVRFWYDNVTSPYYSGIKRSVVAAQGTSRDYTFGGSGKTLRVSYKVDANNPAIYVSLFNTAGTKSTKVKQPIATDNTWQEAWFALSDFSGTVTTNVTAIEIGDGNRANPLLGQGFMYIDNVRIQAMEYVGELSGDISVNHKVDYNDIDMLHDTWLALQVNLVKNSGFNQGTAGMPSFDPKDPNNWPRYWYLWNDTGASESAYVLHINNADPTNLTKPCATIDLDMPTTGYNDGTLCQVIDVNDYNNQNLLISFMHKGNITAPGDTVFEYRPAIDGCSSNWTAGPPLLKRLQRDGQATCADCFGALSWDWEPYTHIMTVNVAHLDDHGQNCRYLHLHFRLCGVPTDEAEPEQYLKIDTVTVAPVGSTIPVGDINLDDKVDMADFAALANNWLKTQPSIP